MHRVRHLGGVLETLDSRLKRIEQRLSSIEKYIAENLSPNKNKDLNITLGRVSEKIEVAKEFRFDQPETVAAVKGLVVRLKGGGSRSQ